MAEGLFLYVLIYRARPDLKEPPVWPPCDTVSIWSTERECWEAAGRAQLVKNIAHFTAASYARPVSGRK